MLSDRRHLAEGAHRATRTNGTKSDLYATMLTFHTGKPREIRAPSTQSPNYRRRRRLQGPLEGRRPHVRRVLPPRPLQIRPIRALQGHLHERRGRGGVCQIQTRDLARRLRVGGGLRGHRALPARNDQGQDPDISRGHVPRAHVRRTQRDGPPTGGDTVSVWLARSSLVAPGTSLVSFGRLQSL